MVMLSPQNDLTFISEKMLTAPSETEEGSKPECICFHNSHAHEVPRSLFSNTAPLLRNFLCVDFLMFHFLLKPIQSISC